MLSSFSKMEFQGCYNLLNTIILKRKGKFRKLDRAGLLWEAFFFFHLSSSLSLSILQRKGRRTKHQTKLIQTFALAYSKSDSTLLFYDAAWSESYYY